MRMEPTRKCSRFVNLTNFDCRHDVRLTQDVRLTHNVELTQEFQMTHHVKLGLIQSYGVWVQQQIDNGWDAYFFSFMFSQLPGSFGTRTQLMERELLKWYGRLATRTVRKPRSSKWAPLLPKGVFVPDLPVAKKSKQDLRDVVINDGLHVHGIVVAYSWGRILEPLDVYFERNLEKYLTGNLRDIHVQPITETPGYVTGYGTKGLKRPTFSPDNILVLPKTLKELPDRKHRSPGWDNPKRTANLGVELHSSPVEDRVIKHGDSGVGI